MGQRKVFREICKSAKSKNLHFINARILPPGLFSPFFLLAPFTSLLNIINSSNVIDIFYWLAYDQSKNLRITRYKSILVKQMIDRQNYFSTRKRNKAA